MSPTITISFDPMNEESVTSAAQLVARFRRSDPVEVPAEVAEVAEVTEVPAETDLRGGLELDANGTPWIEEVHAGGKTKNQDGTWRKKRGVQDSIVTTAEAKARAKLAGTPEPDPQPPVKVEEAPAPVDYPTLVAKFTEMAQAGRITAARMMEIYTECGTTANELTTNETARARVMAALEAEDTDEPTLPGLPS